MLSYSNTATIYLSPEHGDDKYSGYTPTADGLGNGPVKTVERVLYMIDAMRIGGVLHPVTVSVMGDVYLDKTVSIGSKNTSCVRNIYQNVTFESYGDTRARFIGGRRLSGFKYDVFNGVPCFSLYIEDVKNGKLHFTDLYVNGKTAKRTRYPKNGTLEAVDTEFPNPPSLGVGSKWFIAHKEDLEAVGNIENSIITFYHYWIDEHSPVESYDPDSGKLVMKSRSRFWISANYEGDDDSGLQYYLENIPDTFSDPGEWYLDVPDGMLYYIPEDDTVTPDDIEVFAPELKTLFNINGHYDNKVRGVRFKNVEFICSKSDYTSTCKFNGQDEDCAADGQGAFFVQPAVKFENAEDCGIFSSSMTCLGGYGVLIGGGCDSIRVEDCRISEMGAGGVKIVGQPPEQPTGHNVIRGNTITNCGKRHAAACGVIICSSAHNEISENEICYLDYTGISVGWIWGYGENPSYGNIVRLNHVHHIGMGRLSDMGAIYTLGRQSGTVIADNHIHDVKSANYGGWGIYTDEGSSHILIENNTVYRTKTNCFHQNYGSQNTVRGNLFAFGGEAVIKTSRREEHTSFILDSNTFITDGVPIYNPGEGSYPNPAVRAANNKIWDVSGPVTMLRIEDTGKNISLEEMQRIYGTDEGSRIEEPDFIPEREESED